PVDDPLPMTRGDIDHEHPTRYTESNEVRLDDDRRSVGRPREVVREPSRPSDRPRSRAISTGHRETHDTHVFRSAEVGSEGDRCTVRRPSGPRAVVAEPRQRLRAPGEREDT